MGACAELKAKHRPSAFLLSPSKGATPERHSFVRNSQRDTLLLAGPTTGPPAGFFQYHTWSAQTDQTFQKGKCPLPQPLAKMRTWRPSCWDVPKAMLSQVCDGQEGLLRFQSYASLQLDQGLVPVSKRCASSFATFSNQGRDLRCSHHMLHPEEEWASSSPSTT